MDLDPEDFEALGYGRPDAFELAAKVAYLEGVHNERRRVVHDKRTSQPPARVAAARAKATVTRQALSKRRMNRVRTTFQPRPRSHAYRRAFNLSIPWPP